MQEITGNIFDINLKADAICVTTNGVVKANGDLVMGRGIAEQFANKFPDLQSNLGILVKGYGNHAYIGAWRDMGGYKQAAVSFPTKHDWKKDSDIGLIIQSARELVMIADKKGWSHIVLPRPGCGLGRLNWEKDVKPAIKDILDDRFYIITPQEGPISVGVFDFQTGAYITW